MTTATTDSNGRHPVSVFLQAAVPGVTPYCSGKHLWGRSVGLLRGGRAAFIELPGCGDAELGDQVPTVEAMVSHVAERIRTQGLAPVNLVGHDLGALVALVVAMDHPELLSSVCAVSSAWAAPSGDGMDSYVLLHPPQPLWSANSQTWALERLSCSHLHIDEALVEQCVRAAQQPGHLRATVAMKGDGYALTFARSAMRTKFRLFQLARGAGLQVPVQVIAAKQDPQVDVAHMLSLFRILAEKQRRAQFDVINRAGSFPFREQPEEFMRIVQAFADGLAQESMQACRA
jgi:2-hydroxy-6-oxonona-2,4-dienedioate hydrolase